MYAQTLFINNKRRLPLRGSSMALYYAKQRIIKDESREKALNKQAFLHFFSPKSKKITLLHKKILKKLARITKIS